MNRRKFLASSAAVADSVGAPQSSIASILSASPSTAGLDINRPRFGANDRPCHDWSWNDWNAERDLDAEKGQTAWLEKKTMPAAREQGRIFKLLADSSRGKPVVDPRCSRPTPPQERTTDTTWRRRLDWMELKPTPRPS